MPKVKRSNTAVFSVSPWRSRTDRSRFRRSGIGEDGANVDDAIVVHENLIGIRHSNDRLTALRNALRENKDRDQERYVRGVSLDVLQEELTHRSSEVSNMQSSLVKIHAGCYGDVHSSEGKIIHSTKQVLEKNRLPEAVRQFKEGVAVIAYMPSQKLMIGQARTLSGEDNATNMVSFYGTECMDLRECTRDEEWSLMKITIVTKNCQCKIIAEKYGGDAIHIRSPVQWQGEEPFIVADFAQDCMELSELRFDCCKLLADSFAKNVALELFPILKKHSLESSLIVNVGILKIR